MESLEDGSMPGSSGSCEEVKLVAYCLHSVVELGFGHVECELFSSVFSAQARVSECPPDLWEVEFVG